MKFSFKLFVVFFILFGCTGRKDGLKIFRVEYWAEDSAAKKNINLDAWRKIKVKQLSDTCNYRFLISSNDIAKQVSKEVPDSMKIVVSALKGSIRLWLNNVEGELRPRGSLSIFVFPLHLFNQLNSNEVVLKVVDVTGEGGILEPIKIQGIELSDQLEIDLSSFYRLDANGDAGDQIALYNRGAQTVDGKLLIAVRSLTNDWQPRTLISKIKLAASERQEISIPILGTTNPVAVELFFKSSNWGSSEVRMKDTLRFGIHGD